jgi:translocator protein
VVMVCNWVAFLICIAMNASSQSFMEYSLRDITDEWQNMIAPSSFAFSIWGVIYTLLGGFLVYQSMPSFWIPDRNDHMIYIQMNLMFALNMLLNAAWLPIF